MRFVRCGEKSCALLAVYRAQPGRQAAFNKQTGGHFEKIFEHRGRLCGMLVLRNELSFRYKNGGKMLPIRADLDYRVCKKNGQVGFFDIKTFDADHFTYSQITPHQIQRARIYEAYNVPAGFVVFFKPSAQVVYYSGAALAEKGPRSRFLPEGGLLLGSPLTFDLRPIFVNAKWLKG